MTSTDQGERPVVRPTRQRRAVAAALAGFDDFRSAQEIHDLICQQGDSVGLATVYRTLAALADAGEVDMLRNEDGEAIWRSCSDTHHHHLVCRRCGAVSDVDCVVGRAPCLRPSDTAGYVVDEAEVTFWGLCPDCRDRLVDDLSDTALSDTAAAVSPGAPSTARGSE